VTKDRPKQQVGLNIMDMSAGMGNPFKTDGLIRIYPDTLATDIFPDHH